MVAKKPAKRAKKHPGDAEHPAKSTGKKALRKTEVEPQMEISQRITETAYELFEKRGRVHGRDLEDWFEAERIVLTELSARPVRKRKPVRAGQG